MDKLSQSPIMLNHNHRENLHSTPVDPTYGDCILDYLDMPQVSPIHPCTEPDKGVKTPSTGTAAVSPRGPRKTHPFQTHPPSRTVSRCSVELFTSSPPAGAGDTTQAMIGHPDADAFSQSHRQVGAYDNVSKRIQKYCKTDSIITLGKENEVSRFHVDCVPTTHCKAYQMECSQLATTDQSPVSLKKPTATSVGSSQRHRTTHGILQKVANKELLPTTSDLRCDDAAKSLCPIGFSATNSDQSMINPQCFSELDACPISSIVRQSVRKKLDIDHEMMMWAPPDSSYLSIIEHAPPDDVGFICSLQNIQPLK